MLTVYMGWDPRETEAYNVAQFSIVRRTSQPVKVNPLMLTTLVYQGHITRKTERKDGRLWCPISEAPMSTEFAISRFVVPFLQKSGWALFMDPDMLVLDDIANVFALADPKYAVMVVKHNYEPTIDIKMDGQKQTAYARKNWSSFVLWNLDHPSNKKFSREMLNTWPGIALHQFRWLDNDEIGELPIEWNWLDGVYQTRPAAELSNVHFTEGGPWFKNWGGSPYDELWLKERDIMNAHRKKIA